MCTGWTEVGFTTLVTIAARFRHTLEAGGLLRHIGAISELAGMRYWSTTHKQWQILIVDAYALTDSQPGQRREDFTSDEMKEGKVLYFEQVDNLSGKAIYRMHTVGASASRLVLDVENFRTMRYYFIPIFHPGDLQSMYFLDRESGNVWRYYSIVRAEKNANGLIAGNESSSINRAVAFYRNLVGIPTKSRRGRDEDKQCRVRKHLEFNSRLLALRISLKSEPVVPLSRGTTSCSKTVVVLCSERGILDHDVSTGGICKQLKNQAE